MTEKNAGSQGVSNLHTGKLELDNAPYMTSETTALPVVERLLRDSDGAFILNCSKATWWRRVADGTMPQPVRIGSMTRWKLSEVLAVIESLSTPQAPDR